MRMLSEIKRFLVFGAFCVHKPPRGYTFNVNSIEIYHILLQHINSQVTEFALISITLSFSRLSLECISDKIYRAQNTHARNIPRLRVAFRKLSEILTRAFKAIDLTRSQSVSFRLPPLEYIFSRPAHSFPNRNGEFMKKFARAPHLRAVRGEPRDLCDPDVRRLQSHI